MDPAVSLAHQSALRSIARVVEESAPHTEPGRALGDVVKQLREGPVMVLTGGWGVDGVGRAGLSRAARLPE